MAVLLATAGVGISGALPAFAYEFYSHQNADGTDYGLIRFDHAALTYDFSLNADENNYACPSWEQTNVAQAMAHWSSAGTPISFRSSTGSVDVLIRCYTNCADSDAGCGPPAPGGWGGCWSQLTWTSNYWKCTLGMAEINTGSGGSSQDNPTYDVSLAAHELGHALGLAHSCVTASLMSGPNSAAGCPNQPYNTANPQGPLQDDIDGVNALYGGSGGGCAPISINLANISTHPRC